MKTVILGKTPYRVVKRDVLHLSLMPLDTENPRSILLRDPPYRVEAQVPNARWGHSNRGSGAVTWYRQVSDDIFEKIR